MLNLKSIITLLALGVFSASAAPAPGASPMAEAEQPALVDRQISVRVFACEHIRSQGACTTFNAPLGQCYNVPAAWNDRISTIINQDRQFRCVWFEHGSCSGRSYANQVDDNLGDGDGYFNDRISSIRCG
ncbi:hypothetical protein QC764_0097880 [Podospora pseudoanserina]|uniref:Beta/gamma crystallin 'Greek key' domain-containing protein n=1 Tax=Podospora pseudoanserina TaxID=2609844 RepID=A0ABR0HUZ8_9PEZI|nr:hypothetical protein QC764_0097880 [Podospora pseudoanserina]